MSHRGQLEVYWQPLEWPVSEASLRSDFGGSCRLIKRYEVGEMFESWQSEVDSAFHSINHATDIQ